jgi:hypothetical protein
LVSLAITSTAGTAFTNTFSVYVPTLAEQQMAISEFLANPTTNTAAPYFNPLQRATDTIGISTNDQYIEIANQSGSDMGPGGFKIDTGNAAKPVFDANAGAGATLSALNSLVVYGGNSTEAPGLATPVAISSGLFLPKTGSGLLVLRNINGNIIDRVVYAAADLSTNGSLSRFPTINSAFVPQAYISTNFTTAGLQYDGGSWASATKVPTGVTGVVITYVNGQAILNFTANTTQASTLWDASDVTGPYSVIFGKTFPTGTGTFTNVNSATSNGRPFFIFGKKNGTAGAVPFVVERAMSYGLAGLAGLAAGAAAAMTSKPQSPSLCSAPLLRPASTSRAEATKKRTVPGVVRSGPSAVSRVSLAVSACLARLLACWLLVSATATWAPKPAMP